jgi:hypothetical protein
MPKKSQINEYSDLITLTPDDATPMLLLPDQRQLLAPSQETKPPHPQIK